ncbi:uncharacterized protein LOC143459020 [Clavelina lepadiformis]|uniref:uncharacterized protein LOC143459020 n=1 Tax=Clavelina lepadiformis TaxID=159417 RepID=UPI0040426C50
MIRGLAQEFSPCEKDSPILVLFKSNILYQLQVRFWFVFDNSPSSFLHMIISTWLEPKSKMNYFKNVEGVQVKGAVESEMLILQQESMETRNEGSGGGTNRFQHGLPSCGNDLVDLLGCGVDCASNSSDVEEDLVGALHPSAEITSFLKFQPNTTNTLDRWCNNAKRLLLLKKLPAYLPHQYFQRDLFPVQG